MNNNMIIKFNKYIAKYKLANKINKKISL